MLKYFTMALLALFLGTVPSDVAAQDQSKPLDSGIIRLEPGELPDYSDLLLKGGVETELGDNYMMTLNTDVITSNIIFAEVPSDSTYAEMSLSDLVDVALVKNYDVILQKYAVRISQSNARGANANFIPFLDLVGEARYSGNRDENATRTATVAAPASGLGGLGNSDDDEERVTTVEVPTTRETRTRTLQGGFESGVNLPTGGNFGLNGMMTQTENKSEDGSFIIDRTRMYNSSLELVFAQPLLRGGGLDVGTADLRRARLEDLSTELGLRIQLRDTVRSVINAYFQLLQTAQQLDVSSDAIEERLRFLEETRTKYDVGRVAESEILRAEIQYLTELETAINRLRQLDDQRESVLILLGLPLETPISFIDITEELATRGRVDIPDYQSALAEMLSGRPELLRQDLTMKQTMIDQRVARNDVLPQLDLDARYGMLDSDEDYEHSRGIENNDWTAGLSLRFPLQNIARREAAKRASLRVEQEVTRREQLERNLSQEVLSSLRSVLATEAQLTLLRKNVEQARRNLELINGSFDVGFASVTEVRLAQDDLFNSETRYNNALLNYQIQLAALYLALGRPLF